LLVFFVSTVFGICVCKYIIITYIKCLCNKPEKYKIFLKQLSLLRSDNIPQFHDLFPHSGLSVLTMPGTTDLQFYLPTKTKFVLLPLLQEICKEKLKVLLCSESRWEHLSFKKIAFFFTKRSFLWYAVNVAWNKIKFSSLKN